MQRKRVLSTGEIKRIADLLALPEGERPTIKAISQRFRISRARIAEVGRYLNANGTAAPLSDVRTCTM
jgi:hypothetical protein